MERIAELAIANYSAANLHQTIKASYCDALALLPYESSIDFLGGWNFFGQ